MQRLYPISFSQPIFQNIIFMRPLKQLTKRFMHTQTAGDTWPCQNQFFFYPQCWGRGRTLTGRRDVWIWRSGSGCAAAALGPISVHQPLLAYSYSPESNLRRSRTIYYERHLLQSEKNAQTALLVSLRGADPQQMIGDNLCYQTWLKCPASLSVFSTPLADLIS